MQDLSVLPGDTGSFSHVLPYCLPGIALRTEAVAEFGGTPGKQDLSSAAKPSKSGARLLRPPLNARPHLRGTASHQNVRQSRKLTWPQYLHAWMTHTHGASYNPGRSCQRNALSHLPEDGRCRRSWRRPGHNDRRQTGEALHHNASPRLKHLGILLLLFIFEALSNTLMWSSDAADQHVRLFLL